jgi:chromosome segregation ATPase
MSRALLADPDELADYAAMQQRLSEVNQMNRQLIEQNAVLRSQYQDAMGVASQVEDLSQNNAKLIATVSVLTRERDEMARRLEITAQLNDDLKQKCQTSTATSYGAVKTECAQLKETLQHEKAMKQQQISEFKAQLSAVTNELKSQKKENIELTAAIRGLCEAAQKRFGQLFVNPTQLRDYLLALEPPSGDTAAVQLQRAQHRNEKTIAVLRQKLGDAKELNASGQSQLRARDDQIAQLQSELNGLRSELERLSLSHQTDDRGHTAVASSRIQFLEETVVKLRDDLRKEKLRNQELEDLQRRSVPNADFAQLRQKALAQEQELREAKLAIQSLKHSEARLLSQMKACEQSRIAWEDRAGDKDALLSRLNAELSNTKSMISSLQIENGRLTENATTAMAQLSAGRLSFEQTQSAFRDLEGRFEKLTRANGSLADQFTKQQHELEALYREHSTMAAFSQKSSQLLKEAERLLDIETNANRDLRGQVRALKREFSIPRAAIAANAVDPVPITSWFSTEFPPELTTLIRDIAENSSIPLNAKLRQVLTTIGKTYNRLLHASAGELSYARQVSDELVRKIEKVFQAIAPFVERDCSVSRFVAIEEGPAEVIGAVQELKDRFLVQQGELAKLQNIVKEMAQMLRAESVQETRDELEKLLQFTVELRQQLRKTRNKLRQHKIDARQAADAFREQEQEMHESMGLLNERVRSLERERKEHLMQIEASKDELAKLQVDVDRASQAGADHIHAAEDRCREYEQQVKAERGRLAAELEGKTAKIEADCALLQRQESELLALKKSLQRLSLENDAKSEEIEQLRARLDESNGEWDARIEKEKESIRLQTEELLKTVKQKNQELRALCAKTNESMSNTEQHYRALIQRVNSLERELEQLMQQWTDAKEELAREKQLVETKARAAAVRIEMKCQSEIEEIRTSLENEKRRTGACLATHFGSFVDMRRALDSRAFKDVIERASAEMARLRNADAALRRLLCLSADDSTEDAVAKLLSSLYRQ